MRDTTKRNVSKPNAPVRHIMRVSLSGKDCMTCGLGVSWSRYIHPQSPGAATFGHVVPVNMAHDSDSVIGSGWLYDNIGVQCYACNSAAGERDLTHDIIPGSLCSKWVSADIARKWADVRECYSPVLPDEFDRMLSRSRRNLTW